MESIEIPEGFTAAKELGEAARLLDLIADRRNVWPFKNERFDTDYGFTIGFNPNSGYVFAYNEDGMTVFAGDKELILFVSTSWTGQEGTIDEHIENIPYGDYEEDDIDEVRRYVEMSGDEKLIEQFNKAVKEAEEK